MYICGKNSIIEAFKSGKNIQKIYILFNLKDSSISTIYSLAKKNKVPVVRYDKKKFNELEIRAFPKGNKTQGIIAVIEEIETIELNELIKSSFQNTKQPILIMLDGITDPQNLGAIARTSLCAGANGMIISQRKSAPITSTVIKASAGAIEHIPIAKVNNLTQAVFELKQSGFWVVGTDSRADKIYTDNIYNSPLVIILGSEGEGMRQTLKKQCDYLVKIPIYGDFDSLNVSVSAGIILYEIRRQRNQFETLPNPTSLPLK